jgi:hypothetical protein
MFEPMFCCRTSQSETAKNNTMRAYINTTPGSSAAQRTADATNLRAYLGRSNPQSSQACRHLNQPA